MKSFLLTLAALLIGTFTKVARSLNPTLSQLRETWKLEDPYNDEWHEELHNYIMSLGDDETFFDEKMHDEGRLPEHDVVEMTEEMYSEIFNGPEPCKDAWFIAFIRKQRSKEQFW